MSWGRHKAPLVPQATSLKAETNAHFSNTCLESSSHSSKRYHKQPCCGPCPGQRGSSATAQPGSLDTGNICASFRPGEQQARAPRQAPRKVGRPWCCARPCVRPHVDSSVLMGNRLWLVGVEK